MLKKSWEMKLIMGKILGGYDDGVEWCELHISKGCCEDLESGGHEEGKIGCLKRENDDCRILLCRLQNAY